MVFPVPFSPSITIISESVNSPGLMFNSNVPTSTVNFFFFTSTVNTSAESHEKGPDESLSYQKNINKKFGMTTQDIRDLFGQTIPGKAFF